MMTKCQVKKVKFEGPSLFLRIWAEDMKCGSFVSIIRKLKVSLKITRDGHFPIFKLLSLIAIYSLSPFVRFLISLAPFNSFYPPLYISQSHPLPAYHYSHLDLYPTSLLFHNHGLFRQSQFQERSRRHRRQTWGQHSHEKKNKRAFDLAGARSRQWSLCLQKPSRTSRMSTLLNYPHKRSIVYLAFRWSKAHHELGEASPFGWKTKPKASAKWYVRGGKTSLDEDRTSLIQGYQNQTSRIPPNGYFSASAASSHSG